MTDRSPLPPRSRVVATFGGLHILVNNAGIYPPIAFEDTTVGTGGGSCG